ncbi:MAG: hypothetical protein WC869_01655 [Phycisphaerae bacterium]|jgi:hypothetical protein
MQPSVTDITIWEDHDPEVAASLEAELVRFGDTCRYDCGRKKILYRSDVDALHAYVILQSEMMDRHKWIESEKARRDLKDLSLADWIKRHSTAFSKFWRRTHVFVPSTKRPEWRQER